MSTIDTAPQGVTPLPAAAEPQALVPAGFPVRLVAALLDGLILGFVNYALVALAAPGAEGAAGLATIVVGIVYVIGFWVWKGATPGKMALGMTVVTADGHRPIGLGTAVLRYLGYLASGLVFCLGFLWIAFRRDKRGWHDMIAGTLVLTTPAVPGERKDDATDSWSDWDPDRFDSSNDFDSGSSD
ncbi:RDD family protein [Jiella sp. M17.18]|uniref:RDD family protein n=1 Tax=Jiella sp. M17.18 TaxID=3234247 RepID=UPI0034DFE5C3